MLIFVLFVFEALTRKILFVLILFIIITNKFEEAENELTKITKGTTYQYYKINHEKKN